MSTAACHRLLSPKQAGEYLSRSAWTIRQMVRAGQLPYIGHGRLIFLDIEDLNKWIADNKKVDSVSDYG